MKRKAIIAVFLVLCCLSGYMLWAAGSTHEGYDPANDFATWAPNALQIQRALPLTGQKEREAVFRELFQTRFRKHQPGKAIGVHFESNGTITLLTPARLEPWHVDRIAIMLYRETKQNFGKAYHINIYESFIGTAKIKIAEIHPRLDQAKEMNIVFHYPHTQMIVLKPAVETGKSSIRPASVTGYPQRPMYTKPTL